MLLLLLQAIVMLSAKSVRERNDVMRSRTSKQTIGMNGKVEWETVKCTGNEEQG